MATQRLKRASIIFADIIAFYGALLLSLFVRYGSDGTGEVMLQLQKHIGPFSFIALVWVVVFYLFDLYREENLKKNLAVVNLFAKAMAINIVAAIMGFYFLFPILGLSPKTNLILFAAIFSTLDFIFRLTLASAFIAAGSKNNILLIGDSEEVRELAQHIGNTPQIGYRIRHWIKDASDADINDLGAIVMREKINTAIVCASIIKDAAAAKAVYALLPLEVKVFEFADFYELLFKKVPIHEVGEDWFIRNIWFKSTTYQSIKTIIETIIALFLAILLFPLIVLIALLVKLTSTGPVIHRQKRTGKKGEVFEIYKFRSMVNTHNNKPTTAARDMRVTAIGKIIRLTHTDELPQLVNIIRGDISFVGPRPEMIELTDTYKHLPYYEMRHMAKPGITGWAQINYKASESIDEAYEKLKYDIYYIKNQSLILDLLIIIKTIKYFFTTNNV